MHPLGDPNTFTIVGPLTYADGVTPANGSLLIFTPALDLPPGASAGALVTRVTTDDTGNFSVSLPAIPGLTWQVTSLDGLFPSFSFAGLTPGAIATLCDMQQAAITPPDQRPAATTVAAGVQYYDTTLHMPLWSDGAAWRDATGAVV